MPSAYAHYRFGGQALNRIGLSGRELLQRHRRLFDSGLQGPDFFFYYLPMFKTDIRRLGTVFHKKSGMEFFGACVRSLREHPSHQAEAYLFGLLGHYALDCRCHPFVEKHTWAGECGHVELEAEFDRHLLELDGKLPTHRQDLSRLARVAWADCAHMARFFPPAKPVQVHIGFETYRTVQKALASPLRQPINGAMAALGYGELVMSLKQNPKVAHLIPELMACYQSALELYPKLHDSLRKAIDRGEPLCDEFAEPFDIYLDGEED